MIDLKTASAQEIAQYFARITNYYSFNPVKTAEELKDSKQMDDLDICWIKTLASPDYSTDGRNEIAARKGRQLAEIPFIKRKIERISNPKMEETAKKMAWEHRTLQQTFSKLVFYHFMQNCSDRNRQKLIQVMGEDFYKLPLI